MSDLDDILNGAEPAEEVIEPEVEAVEAEPEQQEAEPTGEKEEVKEPQEESTPESKDEPEKNSNWQFEAYQDEKRKRQERDDEIARLRAELEQRKNPREPEKAPDVFDDQDQYTGYLQNQIQQSTLQVKAEMSNFYAEKEFGPEVVQAKLAEFRRMSESDPSLSQRVLNSPSPVYEAIEIVNKAERLKKLENVDDIEAKLRAEVEEKVRAEMEEKYSQKAAKRESVTPSLNSMASSTGSEKTDSLSDLLGGR